MSRSRTFRDARRCGRQGTRLGFTLIELLLVLVIISVVTAVTTPMVMRSMQGHQRRGAVRTVAAAGRYARSMAVLQQVPMALIFELDDHRIRVEPRPQHRGERSDADREVPGRGGGDDTLDVESALDEPGRAGRQTALIERRLERMRLVEVEVDGMRADSEARVVVIYGINGRCTPYRVRLGDDRGTDVLITVDALAGITVEL